MINLGRFYLEKTTQKPNEIASVGNRKMKSELINQNYSDAIYRFKSTIVNVKNNEIFYCYQI